MKGQAEMLRAVAAASDAVIGAAVLTGLGAWAGLFLDERLHSSPWFAVALGLAGAGLGLARMVKKALDAEKRDTDKPGEPKRPRTGADSDNDSGDSDADSIV
ncbi:MAG TPA: AtpZ/AtpI family protein [Candidatus Obscuribacterales bacterium]